MSALRVRGALDLLVVLSLADLYSPSIPFLQTQRPALRLSLYHTAPSPVSSTPDRAPYQMASTDPRYYAAASTSALNTPSTANLLPPSPNSGVQAALARGPKSLRSTVSSVSLVST